MTRRHYYCTPITGYCNYTHNRRQQSKKGCRQQSTRKNNNGRNPKVGGSNKIITITITNAERTISSVAIIIEHTKGGSVN